MDYEPGHRLAVVGVQLLVKKNIPFHIDFLLTKSNEPVISRKLKRTNKGTIGYSPF